MSRVQLFINKTIIYALGLLSLAFGVALSIQAGLGLSPVSSIPYVLSQAAGISLGSWVVIFYAVIILLQILILRKKFKWINLTQILFSTLFGYFVTLTTTILDGFSIPGYAGSLFMMAVSIFLIAVGVSLYVGANLVNMPIECLVAAIVTKLKHKKFYQVKVMVDSSVVVLAILLAFILKGQLYGVREGTVLCALLVGVVMKPVQRVLHPFLNRVLKEPDTQGVPITAGQKEPLQKIPSDSLR